MAQRLVVPIGFIVALAALAFVMQSLGASPTTTDKDLTGSELIKQYEVIPIELPPTELTDKDGKKIDLAAQLSKPTLVTFWSTNCGECEAGLSLLDNFSRDQLKMSIVFIDTKDEPKDGEDKLTSLRVMSGTYYDLNGKTATNWEATTMPA